MDPSWIDIGGVPYAPGSEVTTEQRGKTQWRAHNGGRAVDVTRSTASVCDEAGDMPMLRCERAR